MARAENSHSSTDLPPARRRAARKPPPAATSSLETSSLEKETQEQRIARCAQGNRCWKCWRSTCTCALGEGLNGGSL